jgi:hypothetical protein
VVSRVLGVPRALKKRTLMKQAVEKRVTKQQVIGVLRVYLSALLVLLGMNKDLLLQMTEVSEKEWIILWCAVFEYQPVDMQIFNEILLPEYQQHGFNGLAAVTGNLIMTALFPAGNDTGSVDIAGLKNDLINDVAAILKKNEE